MCVLSHARTHALSCAQASSDSKLTLLNYFKMACKTKDGGAHSGAVEGSGLYRL